MATFRVHPTATFSWTLPGQEFAFAAGAGAATFNAMPAVAYDFSERVIDLSQAPDDRTILFNGENITFAGEDIQWP